MLGNLAGEGVGPYGVVWVDGELAKVLQSQVRAAAAAKLTILCLLRETWHWQSHHPSWRNFWARVVAGDLPVPGSGWHRAALHLGTVTGLFPTLAQGLALPHGNGGIVMAWPPPGSTAGFSSEPGLLLFQQVKHLLQGTAGTPAFPFALLEKGTLLVPARGGHHVCEDVAASGFSLCHFIASNL